MSTSSKGQSYWRGQIIANAVLGALLTPLGVVFMALSADDKGLGLIFFLVGLGFFAAMFWVLRQYRRMSQEQRDIYAWAIAQQMSGSSRRSPGSDVTMMATATMAKDGTLPRGELQRLQNLNPRNPYPARKAPSSTPDWTGPFPSQ